jgi:hypothetical protein
MQLFVMIKKKNILVKLKIFIHILFSIQEIIIIFFRIKIKKKKIILAKLFNTKFGHFYFNTENFLKYKFRKKNLIIFYPEEPFDRNYYELKEEIKKFGLIISFGAGFFFTKFAKFLGWEFCDLRNYTFLKQKKDYFKTPNLFFEKKNSSFFYNKMQIATFSIRTSSYNYLTSPHNFGKDPFAKWRDTNQKDLIFGLKKFNLQKQYNFFLINDKIKETGFLNKIKSEKNIKWFDQENYSLKKIFNIVSNAKFHLASATGIDTFAYTNNIPTAVMHQTLGGGIQSIYYSKKIIVCPMNLFSIKKKRILTLNEQLDYHQHLQKNHNIDRFELDMQKKYKCFYLKSSWDEIFHLLQEIDSYVQDKPIFCKKNDKILQNLFWKRYPDKWFYPGVKQPIFEKTHGVIISPYFLRKYNKYLF